MLPRNVSNPGPVARTWSRTLVAKSLLLKHQLLVNRPRPCSPNLFAWDRILAGLLALSMVQLTCAVPQLLGRNRHPVLSLAHSFVKD
jgi:hypothetical protein